jgi:LPXTG-motif cell wall-anchored protein
VRTTTHNYSDKWSSDAEKHWYECSVCADKINETMHTAGADATETSAQLCTVCGYVITPALGHAHKYDTQKNDENSHWNECACGDKADNAPHVDKNTDEECDVCKYNMPINEPKPDDTTDVEPKPDDTGASTGVVVAIAVGAVALGGVALAVFWFFKKKKSL